MGEVFRVRDDRLERDVAVKIIRPASSADQDRIRRFEQEARAAAALSHPNILAIYDIGIYDGTPTLFLNCSKGKPCANVSSRVRFQCGRQQTTHYKSRRD